MRGVGADRGHGRCAIPKTEHLEPGIDQALGQIADGRVARGAVASENRLAVGADHAAIRRHVLDFGLAHAKMRHALGRLQPVGQRSRHALDRALMKIGIDDVAVGPGFGQQPFGGQIGQRRIVLVHAGDQHPLGRGAGRLGQDLAPASIGVVANLAPIDRHQHDRLLRSQQHQSVGRKGIVDRACRRKVTTQQRMPQPRSNVGAKHGHTKTGWRVGHALGPGQQAASQHGCRSRDRLPPGDAIDHLRRSPPKACRPPLAAPQKSLR